MQSTFYTDTPVSGQSRTVRIGALLSTVTSTVMTILLLASMASGWLSTVLLATAGLGFELLKWCSWTDAWRSHYQGQHDRRNIMALLCTLAVILSIGASIATTRSNLAISANDTLQAQQQQTSLLEQILQKQAAIDVCTAANRITLCARPLQEDVSRLQADLNDLVIPAPDEATALILDVAMITGLPFDQAATGVMALVSVMLDAAGLAFLFLQQDGSQVNRKPVYAEKSSVERNITLHGQNPAQGLHTDIHSSSEAHTPLLQLDISVRIDETLKDALQRIQAGDIKPSVRSLAQSMNLPQHTAQTLLYWLSDGGYLQRQPGGKGYRLASQKTTLNL
ncbi:MAG: hypothetical protein ACR2PT_15535 [Endozoicomonas sp.]